MKPLLYIRYVAITIVICTSMLVIFFCRTKLCSFHGCFFDYLSIFIHLQFCGISLTRFNEFRTFWPCSFVDPLVKGTDKLWKIRGLIGRFNESRKKLLQGKEKYADESMNAIKSRTTPKGDLTN